MYTTATANGPSGRSPMNVVPRGSDPRQHQRGSSRSQTAVKEPSAKGDYNTYFLPKRATYVLSILKLICGCGLVILGALALYMKASYGRTASGVWGGIVVIISAVLGIFTAKMNGYRPYVFFFFCASVLAIITDVLVTIYAATGLAKDSGYPGGFILDDFTGDLIPVSQVNIPAREKAMVINLLLIVMGVFEILFTLPCFIICLREICQCYDEEYLLSKSQNNSSNYSRQNEWMSSWLGQQSSPAVFYSASSGIPYRKVQPYPVYGQNPPPYFILPSEHSRQGSSRQPLRNSPGNLVHHHHHRGASQQPCERSPSYKTRLTSTPRSSGRRSTLVPHYTPLEVYAPPPHTHYYYAPPPSYHSPGSNLSQRSIPALVPVHASSSQMVGPQQHTSPHHSSRAPPYQHGHAPLLQHAHAPSHQHLHVPSHQHPHAPSHQHLHGQSHQQPHALSHSHALVPPPQTWFYGSAPEDYDAYLEGRPFSRRRPADPYGVVDEGPKGKRSRVPPPASEPYSEEQMYRRVKKKKTTKSPVPTDSDLDKTYTGLDRELAEEFIEQTMDPNMAQNRSVHRPPSVTNAPSNASLVGGVPQGSSVSNSQYNPRMSTFSVNDSEEAW